MKPESPSPYPQVPATIYALHTNCKYTHITICIDGLGEDGDWIFDWPFNLGAWETATPWGQQGTKSQYGEASVHVYNLHNDSIA